MTFLKMHKYEACCKIGASKEASNQCYYMGPGRFFLVLIIWSLIWQPASYSISPCCSTFFVSWRGHLRVSDPLLSSCASVLIHPGGQVVVQDTTSRVEPFQGPNIETSCQKLLDEDGAPIQFPNTVMRANQLWQTRERGHRKRWCSESEIMFMGGKEIVRYRHNPRLRSSTSIAPWIVSMPLAFIWCMPTATILMCPSMQTDSIAWSWLTGQPFQTLGYCDSLNCLFVIDGTQSTLSYRGWVLPPVGRAVALYA